MGSKVQKPWKRGDRIAGFAHGGNEVQPEDGCFAEYCVVKDGIGFKVFFFFSFFFRASRTTPTKACLYTELQIPDHMTDEEACTLGIGVTTVGQALYQSLGLPLPGASTQAAANFPILIYGGSTATGSLAIQYARLSGCSRVITTCSERNFALAEAVGAHAAFDYRDPQCARQIRGRTADRLAHALDCVSTKESAETCAAAIGSAGGAVSYLLPAKHERQDVQVKYTLGYTVFGEYFRVAGGREFAARPEDFAFGRMFWELSERLITEGRIRPHPFEVGKDGLRGVFEGLQAMREGRVSGRKLVYRIEETP